MTRPPSNVPDLQTATTSPFNPSTASLGHQNWQT
jgi:hypothetical protein